MCDDKEKKKLQQNIDKIPKLNLLPIEIMNYIWSFIGAKNKINYSKIDKKYIVLSSIIKHNIKYKPNERCFCGSDSKYKKCCSKYYTNCREQQMQFFGSTKYYKNTNIAKWNKNNGCRRSIAIFRLYIK